MVGNLTRDPELNQYGATTVCKMRLAVNDRVKDQNTGEWTDKPMYFDWDAFGRLAETCAQFLKRGSRVTVEGKAKWREWEKDGVKRQAVSFAVDNIVFPTRKESEGGGAYAGTASNAAPPVTNAPPQQDFNRKNFDPSRDPDFQEPGVDDDIPF